MNKVCIIGRLTADPELRYTQSQLPVCSGTVAVNRNITKEQREAGAQTADFIRFIIFGKQAEVFQKYHFKGSQVAFEGRIQTGSYEDKDGKKVYTTDVVVERFDFVGSKSDRQSAPQGTQGTYVPNQPQNDPQLDGFMAVSDSEVPF